MFPYTIPYAAADEHALVQHNEKIATNDDFCLVSMYLSSCRVIVYTIFKLAADSASHSQLTNITLPFISYIHVVQKTLIF